MLFWDLNCIKKERNDYTWGLRVTKRALEEIENQEIFLAVIQKKIKIIGCEFLYSLSSDATCNHLFSSVSQNFSYSSDNETDKGAGYAVVLNSSSREVNE